MPTRMRFGRFLQEDPIWFNAGRLNIYGYVGANPIMRTDPYGLTDSVERASTGQIARALIKATVPVAYAIGCTLNIVSDALRILRVEHADTIELVVCMGLAVRGAVTPAAAPKPPTTPTKFAPPPKLGPSDFPSISRKISQKQGRHIEGHSDYRRGGRMATNQDAQKVLDAYHAGDTTIIGQLPNGNILVQFNGVTGTHVSGVIGTPTNTFMIKGTAHPSVVPVRPGKTPK